MLIWDTSNLNKSEALTWPEDAGNNHSLLHLPALKIYQQSLICCDTLSNWTPSNSTPAATKQSNMSRTLMLDTFWCCGSYTALRGFTGSSRTSRRVNTKLLWVIWDAARGGGAIIRKSETVKHIHTMTWSRHRFATGHQNTQCSLSILWCQISNFL